MLYQEFLDQMVTVVSSKFLLAEVSDELIDDEYYYVFTFENGFKIFYRTSNVVDVFCEIQKENIEFELDHYFMSLIHEFEEIYMKDTGFKGD